MVKKLKPDHNGAKNSGGAWMAREEAKSLSKVERRKVGKNMIQEAMEAPPEPAVCFWCGEKKLLNDKDECAECAG